jgi:hypothetical protein
MAQRVEAGDLGAADLGRQDGLGLVHFQKPLRWLPGAALLRAIRCDSAPASGARRAQSKTRRTATASGSNFEVTPDWIQLADSPLESDFFSSLLTCHNPFA